MTEGYMDLALGEGASAIIEHAKNLPMGIGRHGQGGEQQERIITLASPAVNFPSESGHWYDPRTGNQVELPPRTWAKTAIAKGYVPGVTSITRVAHKEAIRRYDINRAIKFAGQVSFLYPGGGPTDEILLSETWELLNADSEATTGRGKELHAAIELFSQNKPSTPKWDNHLNFLEEELENYDLVLRDGSTEHSFATSRYGGKIDWHNDEWLLDFKTKPKIEDGKKLAYPEHAQQLAAYDMGLSPHGVLKRKCANVFVGVEDARVVFHEWSEKDLLKGWRKFEALLNVWWCDYE